MPKRIYPIAEVDFKKVENETIQYVNDRLEVYRSQVKCLKIIEDRYKVYVDYGFKGNSRYADDQSDFYVVDTKDGNAILVPSANDYGSIVDTLEKKAEKERPVSAYVSDMKVMVLTMSHLVADGWLFNQEANGDVSVSNPGTSENRRFSTDEKLKQWVIGKSLEY